MPDPGAVAVAVCELVLVQPVRIEPPDPPGPFKDRAGIHARRSPGPHLLHAGIGRGAHCHIHVSLSIKVKGLGRMLPLIRETSCHHFIILVRDQLAPGQRITDNGRIGPEIEVVPP